MHIVASKNVIVGQSGPSLKGIVVATATRILVVDKGKRGVHQTSSIPFEETESVVFKSDWLVSSIEIRDPWRHKINNLSEQEPAAALAQYADSRASWRAAESNQQRITRRDARSKKVEVAIQEMDPYSRSLLVAREIRELPKILWDEELPEMLVNGCYDGSWGILIATNRRLIFVDKGFFGSLKIEDFDYEKIASVESKTGLLYGEIMFHATGNSETLNRVSKDQTRRFADFVRQKIYSIKDARDTWHSSLQPAIDAPARNVSIADKLIKFAQLREKGVIDDDEFAAQKSRLLDSVNNPRFAKWTSFRDGHQSAIEFKDEADAISALDIIIIMSNAHEQPPPERRIKQSAADLQREQQPQRRAAVRAGNFKQSFASGQAIECPPALTLYK